MKKLFMTVLMLGLLAIPVIIWSQTAVVSVKWTHTFAAADTAATTKIADTSYSDPFELTYPLNQVGTKRQMTQIGFYHVARALSGYTDSNWTNDTMIINLRLGVKKAVGGYEWLSTVALDTFVARDSGMSTIYLNRTSTTAYPNYARFQIIRRDSLEVTAQSKIGLKYGADCQMYMIPILGQPSN